MAVSRSAVPPWRLEYPQELPITARREEIVALLRSHPVVVVAGETGSGKTTQIPKLCLEAGLADRGIVACTQPRRVAALSISRRVAEELGVEWGREVGCKIRFDDRTTRDTRVKFLTDGMLLAEAQADPLLRIYSAVIVDEAHERSLNIDFLIGHLRRLRERRPDLRVVVTSATIDTRRFSEAFGGAPVVEVSGRMYPVEVVYAPVDELLEERGEYTMIEAVVESVARVLAAPGGGDVLVFLACERDIREACEVLSGRLAGVDVLPLYGRLASADQQRVFGAVGRRKVVVATNIAETSLTIPGIRYVVDTGEARIARYNPRTRTRRLPIEKISRASADQRKGRCGRVREGVCVRLYSEADYLDRPEFTQPEIQRCNLAEVILRLMAANLGEIETFPFIDPPVLPAIRAGYQLLEEIGAIEPAGGRERGAEEEPGGAAAWRLAPLGRELARLPIDPTIGRMLLQARREHALREVLVVASALAIQDPRERPLGEEAAADAAHRRFVHADSDFLTLLAIWDATHDEAERLTQGRLRRFCRDHFLSFQRMREWMETHQQLARLLDELGFPLEQSAPDAGEESRRYPGSFYRAVHRSLVPGLLANAARREEGNQYKAGGDRKVMVFPGSGLFQRSERKRGERPAAKAPQKPPAPEWILCAEVIETTRLYARTCARVDPKWLLELGWSVVRRSYGDPVYLEEQQRVVVRESARLHGLEIDRRHVDYGRIDPAAATEIFIREALVGDRLRAPHAFLEHNRRVKEKVELLRTRLRTGDILAVDEALFRHYRARLPEPVASVHDLNRVIGERIGKEPKYLCADETDLMGEAGEAWDPGAFPDEVELENSALPIHYAYKPGDDRDGATLRVPVQRAKALKPGILDWLVPALLPERIEVMLRGLPKHLRVRLHPIAETAASVAREIRATHATLGESLAAHLRSTRGVEVEPGDFESVGVPVHLQPRVEIVDEAGRVLAAGRSVGEVSAALDERVREASRVPEPAVARLWREAADRWERAGFETWTFGDLPETLEVGRDAGVPILAWPGLRVEEGTVARRLFRTAADAARSTPPAVAQLIAHELRYELGYLRDDLSCLDRLKLLTFGFAGPEALQEDAYGCLWRHLCEREVRPLTAAAFRVVAAGAKDEARGLAFRLLDLVKPVLEARLELGLANDGYPGMRDDVDRLISPDFLARTPYVQVRHLPRYLKAVQARREKARQDPKRDAVRALEVKKAADLLAGWRKGKTLTPAQAVLVEEYRWMLEEYRVSVFAQELGTAVPVSLARFERKLAELIAAGAPVDVTAAAAVSPAPGPSSAGPARPAGAEPSKRAAVDLSGLAAAWGRQGQARVK